jgi:hypothetical protein
MAHDVFISYSNHDMEVAQRVCNYLEHRAVACWLAPRDVLAGKNFGAAIVAAIETCKVVVVIFSSSANSSKQVIREVKIADDYEKAVIPLRIEHVTPNKDLAYFLGSAHWIQVTDRSEQDDLNTLHAALMEYIGRSKPHSSSDDFSSVPETDPFAASEVRTTLSRAANPSALAIDEGVALYLGFDFGPISLKEIEVVTNISREIPAELRRPGPEILMGLPHDN